MNQPTAAPLKLGVNIFTSGQVARFWGTSPKTGCGWADGGLLRCARLPRPDGSDGDRRFLKAAVVAFARERGLPLPEGFADGPAEGEAS